MKKKLDPKFNVYVVPQAPKKPTETLKGKNRIKKFEIGQYESIQISDLIDGGGDSIHVWSDDGEINIEVYSAEAERPNPDYEKQLAVYKRVQAKYVRDKADYDENLAIYQEQKEKAEKKARLEQYKKLKEEFGSTSEATSS